MRSLFIREEILFTGEQLTSFWAYKNYDILGDNIVAFIGPCQVDEKFIIGIDHFKKKTQIESERMLHFLVEHFDLDLEKAILRQKLLVDILKDKLNHRLKGEVLQRWGDDLFDTDYKLTVSATVRTTVSAKIHLGINISSKNTPVKTKGLDDYGIDPHDISQAVMDQYRLDMRLIAQKLCKTRSIE
ncbi:MAG: DUF366 family protein [candidate division Zixibacteria bacterium]|nr:DUF366 family protein [candidate division Zixibacteria bacterium]